MENGGRPHRWRAAAAVIWVMAGCGPPKVATNVQREPPPPEVPPPTRLAAVFVLESSGVPAEDTTLSVPTAKARTIVLRHGPPDNSQFAQVNVGRAVNGAAGPDSVTVTVRPRPGIYGIDIEANRPLDAATTVTFSYAVHFMPPAGARQRYGTDLAFERALYVARIESDSTVIFLPTTRPGSDLLSAPIPGVGRYLVVAPR